MILILPSTLNLFNQISPEIITVLVSNGEIKQTNSKEPIQYLKLNEDFDFNSVFSNNEIIN